MTKRQFISLADALRNVELSDEALEALMTWCEAQSPQFLRDRWLSYLRGECGPGGGRIKEKQRAERN
jgi:hypothetical protein